MGTDHNQTSTRYGGNASSRTHAFGGAALAGDVIMLVVHRANGSVTGAVNHATATDYVEVGHIDPTNTFRTFATVLKKVAIGGETSVTVDWGATDGEPDQIISAWFARGIDEATVAASFATQSGTTWTYPTGTGDNVWHAGSIQQNTDVSATLYPTGDTAVTHSVVDWRNGGFARSGGNTGTPTHAASVRGVAITITADDSGSTTYEYAPPVTFTTFGYEYAPPVTFTTPGWEYATDFVVDGSGIADQSDRPVSYITSPNKQVVGDVEITGQALDVSSSINTSSVTTRLYRVEGPQLPARVREAKLGDGTNIRVEVVGRFGGQAPSAVIADLSVATLTGQFDRRLDETSEAAVRATFSSLDLERCCNDLELIETYAHELRITWDGIVAWVGPITYVRHRIDGIELRAADLSVHYETRTLGEHIHTGVDLATIFSDYHRDAYLQDPWGMDVLAKPVGSTGTREVLASQGMVASRAIDEIARTGIDWTAYGRTLIVGGEEVQTKPIATLTDEHFTSALEVVEDGTLRATDVVVSGDGVSGRATEPADSELRRRYGLITARSQELNIKDQSSAQTAARTRLDYYRDPVYIDPGVGALKPVAPVSMIDLIPGSRIRIASSATCRTVSQVFRLSRVVAGMDGAVRIAVQPLGSTTSGT